MSSPIKEWVGWICLVLLAAAMTGLSQVTTASLLGTVQDETGAPLPGVAVAISNVETGLTRTAVTDEHGRYVARQLALGEYQIKAELPGFQTAIRRGIRLTLGREAVVDFTMKVGEIVERVVVTGEAPLVESTHAMVSGHVEERQMRQLPLNARSFLDLTLLQAGTVQARTAGASFGDTGTHITVSGSRPTATTFLLDGTVTTSVRGKGPASIAGAALGVDAIREFEVITSPYSAEYGRGTGGTVSVVSRSGTNLFHGTVFYFHRNDNLDAGNVFDDFDTASKTKLKPEFKRNQFGFSLGGPIIRNRTFFFGNYEGLRQRLGTTNIFQVLTAQGRRGILPTGTVSVKPEVRPYLDVLPLPNGRDFGDGTGEFVTSFSRPTDEDFFTTRVDHEFSSRDSFFARYTYSDAFDGAPANLQMFVEENSSRSQFVTLEEKRIFSPRLLNVIRFGYTRHNLAAQETPLVTLDPGLALQQGTFMPQFAVSGLDEIGSADVLPRYFIDNTFEVYDSVHYTRGSHALKAGAQIQRMQNNVFFNTRQASRWNFGSVQDFLSGNASRVQIAPRELADPQRYMRQTFVAWFIQDDIRITRRLTFNLGLRSEWTSTITEKFGKLAAMPSALYVTGTFDDIKTGDPWYSNPGMTFGPRAGLAWDPFGDGRTSIRAGFGIFYDHIWAWWSSGTGNFRMGPFYNTFDLRERFSFPLKAQQFVELLRQRQGRQVPFGNQIYQHDENPARQRNLQYSVNVQRQVASDIVVKVGYKGSRGIHIPRVTDFNTALPDRIVDGLPVFSLRPRARNPLFGTMHIMPTDSDSFYNALLVEVNKRFSKGLQFQVAYTFSKMIDEGSGVRTAGDAIAGAGGGTVLSYEFRKFDRALSTFDVRHNFVSNFVMELPFGAGRHFPLGGPADTLFGGWELNSIVTLSSGHPATIGQGTTAATSLLGGSRRPDLIPGGDNNPRLGGPDRYFDRSQFKPADPQRYGNVGRGTLIAPGFANVDFSLIKNFRVPSLSEDFLIAFRAEFFNLFNRANFGLPSTSVFDGSGRALAAAGRITRTNSPARQVQFGLRLSW
ncbi:MAG: TonB-dependent receptor [Acidobacteria bacterium]|nr:TonB-dependent receptor [Acidobacteriota bacterium]